MRILIVTGIFEPESGGPATYAPRLARSFVEAGHSVTVLTFSGGARYPSDDAYPFALVRVARGNKILNRVRMFLAARRRMPAHDVVYMLDWFAAGLPAALAAGMAGKPYVVRVGGDYVWEQKYLEAGKRPLPLADFYARGLHRRLFYRVYFLLNKGVLSRAAHVVFNSDRQRELYGTYYELPMETTTTIWNPLPRSETKHIHRGLPTREFVYWGRMIVMKNLDSLIRAFARARIPESFSLTLIGEGPRLRGLQRLVRSLSIETRVRFEPALPLDSVLQRVKDCRAFILPSWTDISPNQVYESLALGLPALVTKENYLSIAPQLPLTVDPSSLDDMTSKIEVLANDEKYRQFSEAFSRIQFEHTWNDVRDRHLAVFETVV